MNTPRSQQNAWISYVKIPGLNGREQRVEVSAPSLHFERSQELAKELIGLKGLISFQIYRHASIDPNDTRDIDLYAAGVDEEAVNVLIDQVHQAICIWAGTPTQPARLERKILTAEHRTMPATKTPPDEATLMGPLAFDGTAR